jgi:hypothetical protein
MEGGTYEENVIAGAVGWHTFRHSFGTLMKANGET